jgi:hypothetical protein
MVPHRIKALNRSTPKLAQFHNKIELIKLASLLKIGQAVPPPLLGEVVCYRYYYFFFFFSGTRTANAERSNPTCDTSIDAVWLKDMLFGVSTQKNIPWGLITKPLLGREWGFPA